MAPPGADEWTWALNLFSLALGILTLAVANYLAVRLAGEPLAGTGAVAVLLLSPTFLAQSTVANIRMPTALLGALTLLVTAAVPMTALGAFAATAVLTTAVLHHLSLAFMALPAAALLVWRWWSRPVADAGAKPASHLMPVLAAVAGILVGLLPIAYLPLRDAAGAVLAPGNLTTFSGLIDHVTAAGFRGDMLRYVNAEAIADRGRVLADITRFQFAAAHLVLGVLGAVVALRRRTSLGLATLTALGLLVFGAVTYRAPQTMEYLLPAYVLVACLAGGGIAVLATTAARAFKHARSAGFVSAIVVLGLALVPLWPRRYLPSMVTVADAAQAPRVDVLRPDCFDGRDVLASWHFAPPMWYAARHAYGRSDLAIDYVFPVGADPIGVTWLGRLEAASADGRAPADGPILLTNLPAEVRRADVPTFPVPRGDFFSTAPTGCPEMGLDVLAAPATFQLDSAFLAEIPAANDSATASNASVVLADAALRIPTGLSSGVGHASPAAPELLLDFDRTLTVTDTLVVFAQLLEPGTGAVWAQADRPVRPIEWSSPSGPALEVRLVPFRGDLPPSLDVVIGVYKPGTELRRLRVAGSDSLRLGRVELRDGPPAVRPGEVPFGQAMTLLDARAKPRDRSLVVDLVWLAEQAYVSDYTISVQAEGPGWFAQDDGTPALGMVPTLKWLPGMVLLDRHLLELPDQASLGDGYRVRVAVYDAFTLETLPVTDASRVAQGQGQSATVIEHESGE